MNSPEPSTKIDLPGILSVTFYDQSKVYFGDYYHVKLEVNCEIQVPLMLVSAENRDGGLADAVIYRRILEKMAVPSAAVEDTRRALIAEFRSNSLPYLSSPAFAANLLARSSVQHTAVKIRYTECDR